MSDTPRTDAEMVKSCHENDGAFLAEDMMFFARDLERENARLRETLNRTHRAYLCLQGVSEKQATKTADVMFPVSFLPNV